MTRFLHLILSVLFCSASAQELTIQFKAQVNSEPLVLSQKYYLSSLQDSVKIETLRFYVSDLAFYKGEELLFKAEERFHLIDMEGQTEIKIPAAHRDIDKIAFSIGIDSITNHAGALGGTLDPTNGMYWTWQSGYINFKLEGRSPACSNRNNFFQFHIGGYGYPNNSLRRIELPVSAGKEIIIHFDLNRFFSETNLAEYSEIMSPGPKAMKVADTFQKVFIAAP